MKPFSDRDIRDCARVEIRDLSERTDKVLVDDTNRLFAFPAKATHDFAFFLSYFDTLFAYCIVLISNLVEYGL